MGLEQPDESRRAALTAALASAPCSVPSGLERLLTFQYLLRLHRLVWAVQVAAGFAQQVRKGDGHGRHRRLASPLQHCRKLVDGLVCGREFVLRQEEQMARIKDALR